MTNSRTYSKLDSIFSLDIEPNMPKFSKADLDDILIQTLQYLARHWLDKDVGIEAATLVDGERSCTATSTRDGDKFIHAERNVIQKFIQEYKELPSKNAAIVITFSPCVKDMRERFRESCTELLLKAQINRIHIGALDPTQKVSLLDFQKLGFEITHSKNIKYVRECEKLLKFLRYPQQLNDDLLKLKQSLPELAPLSILKTKVAFVPGTFYNRAQSRIGKILNHLRLETAVNSTQAESNTCSLQLT